MNENKTPTEAVNEPTVETKVDTTLEPKVTEIVPKEATDDVTFEESQNNNAEPKVETKEVTEKEQNRINAQRRIEEKKKQEALRKEKELIEARKQGELEGLNKTNPFLEQEIKTEADYQLYKAQKEMKAKGLEYMDMVSVFNYMNEEREKETKAQEEAIKKETESKDKFDKEFSDFTAKYPNIDLEKLNKDELFREILTAQYMQGGNITTAFEKFNNLYLSKVEKEKLAFAIRERARDKAAPIVTEESGVAESEFYSMEEIKNMTVTEVRKNMDKVNRSLAHYQSSK